MTQISNAHSNVEDLIAAIEVGRKHAVGLLAGVDLIEAMSALPLGTGKRLHLIDTKGGGKFALLEDCPRKTRGPTPVCWWDGKSDILETASPSTSIEGASGQPWHGCDSAIGSVRWSSTTNDERKSSVGGQMPDEVVSHVTWDRLGCRRLGEQSAPGPTPGPPPQPAPGNKWGEAWAMLRAYAADPSKEKGRPGIEAIASWMLNHGVLKSAEVADG